MDRKVRKKKKEGFWQREQHRLKSRESLVSEKERVQGL
jgi:hypothetical protein